MKKLPAGMERYIAKKVDKAWRVYDKARGSFPYQGGDAGTVQQDVPEELAKAEADRLNHLKIHEEKTGGPKSIHLEDGEQLAAKTTKQTKAVADDESIQAGDAEELPVTSVEVFEEEIADYGVMTPEERAAYEAAGLD